jgi:hypothetical protein
VECEEAVMQVEKQLENQQLTAAYDRIVAIVMRQNQLVIAAALEILLASVLVSVAHWSVGFLEGCRLVET